MEKWKELFNKFDIDTERCTCLDCNDKSKCPYAYDIYNVDGDCLKEK